MRSQLRRALRTARRAIPLEERASASRRAAQNVDQAFHLHALQRIGLFSSLPEELDTGPLLTLARSRGCVIYLPRIDRRARTMRFVRADAPLRVNQFGIAEPQGTCFIGARWLNLVFVPLVGFDQHGTRLGMGGGYYDRAFAFRHLRKIWTGPRLIGLGFALQQVPSISVAAHDVSLDAVVTEAGCLFF